MREIGLSFTYRLRGIRYLLAFQSALKLGGVGGCAVNGSADEPQELLLRYDVFASAYELLVSRMDLYAAWRVRVERVASFLVHIGADGASETSRSLGVYSNP